MKSLFIPLHLMLRNHLIKGFSSYGIKRRFLYPLVCAIYACSGIIESPELYFADDFFVLQPEIEMLNVCKTRVSYYGMLILPSLLPCFKGIVAKKDIAGAGIPIAIVIRKNVHC